MRTKDPMKILSATRLVALYGFSLLALAGCSPRVPRVVGLDASIASYRLVKAGFSPIEKPAESAQVPLGKVISQSPKAGENLPKSSQVSIYVSRGKTLKGELILKEPLVTFKDEGGSPCPGRGGYADIAPGLDIVVKDNVGSILGVGNLGEGKIYGNTIRNNDLIIYHGCSFEFQVDNIPRSDFYEIVIGKRGSQTYKRSDLDAQNWNVTYTLGGK